MCSVRGRHARLGQRAAGRQLVVRRDERAGAVEDLDAGALEPRQLPESDLDPVELLRDVEPADRHVASGQRPQALHGRQHAQAWSTACQRDVRWRPPVGDDRGEHLVLSVGSGAGFLRAGYHIFTGGSQLVHQPHDLVSDRPHLFRRPSGRILRSQSR